MSTETPGVEPAVTDLPADPPRTDIYVRIRRWAPLLVVVFCAGILLVMAVLRPFPDPGADPVLRDAMVGADNDPTGAYMVIDNDGGSDTLLGATTDAAERVELQQRQGVTETDPAGRLVTVDELPIRGYEATDLQPGGDQILLNGLVRPLAVGDTVEITLDFERAGTVTVDARVETYDEIARVLLGPRLVIPDPSTPSSTPAAP
jgi:copper(I)-binding protein